jgi:hypothetical protein
VSVLIREYPRKGYGNSHENLNAATINSHRPMKEIMVMNKSNENKIKTQQATVSDPTNNR